MDIAAFSEYKTGKLAPIKIHGRDDHAFVPSPLPPSVVTNDSFWPLLMEARTKLERLDVLGSKLPDLNLLLRPLQRREALTSNSLEGTFVTPQELLLFEAGAVKSEHGGGRDDWREVFAYDQALTHGCRLIQDGHPLNNELIQRLHFLLMDASARGKEKNPGRFRTKQVIVGHDRRYVPPPAEELAAQLANFETYLAASPAGNLHPLLAAYVAHYQFEAIHPFEDGNGRIGRLILSLCIYKWLGLQTPCLYMSEFFEKNRKDYISHLFRISTHGEWDDWLKFCLVGTIEQAAASIVRCEALESLKNEYERILGNDARPRLLLDDIFKSPFITVADVQRRFGVSYRPASRYLQRMVSAQILTEMKNHYPKTFLAHKIFAAAYGD